MRLNIIDNWHYWYSKWFIFVTSDLGAFKAWNNCCSLELTRRIFNTQHILYYSWLILGIFDGRHQVLMLQIVHNCHYWYWHNWRFELSYDEHVAGRFFLEWVTSVLSQHYFQFKIWTFILGNYSHLPNKRSCPFIYFTKKPTLPIY